MLKFDEETTRLLEAAYLGSDVARRRRMAFDALYLTAGDRVVDIGCGNGLLTEEIARAVGKSGRVLAVDPSADMRRPAMARCADYPTVRFGLAWSVTPGSKLSKLSRSPSVIPHSDPTALPIC